MKMYYDERNDHIYCTDAYDCKDILKGMGFRWNSIGKAWFITRPQDLGNMICDIFVECKMDYFDFCEFIAMLPENIAASIVMDDIHTAKFQAATADI